MSEQKPDAKDGKTQDWSEVLKGATPEAVARALLQPRKPIKAKAESTAVIPPTTS